MIGSLILNGALGFAFLVAILYCMGDFATALATNTGFPIIQIFYQITGNRGTASAMSAAVIVMATLATIPLVASAARVLWSLARDSGLPCSNFLSHVDESRAIPTRAILITTGFLALIGLLNIASTTAFNAITSLAVVGLYVSTSPNSHSILSILNGASYLIPALSILLYLPKKLCSNKLCIVILFVASHTDPLAATKVPRHITLGTISARQVWHNHQCHLYHLQCLHLHLLGVPTLHACHCTEF